MVLGGASLSRQVLYHLGEKERKKGGREGGRKEEGRNGRKGRKGNPPDHKKLSCSHCYSITVASRQMIFMTKVVETYIVKREKSSLVFFISESKIF
jgi:hypothetical protein